MKVLSGVLLCLCVVIVSAKSKIRRSNVRTRQVVADEDPFTLSFGTPAPTGCTDASSNCAMLNQQVHICTDAGAKIYAQQNCALTCGMCSGGGGGGGGSTSCYDAINNCNAYDPSMCSNPDYKQWATQNCALTCHLCGTGPAILMTAAPATAAPMPVSGGCHDAINNCKSYNPSICTDANYRQWVTQNCAQTCHMCGSGPGMPSLMTAAPATAAPMPVSGGCQDAINNCKSYDPSICTDPSYKQWVTQNCAMTCHMCGSGPVISMTQAPMQPMQPSSGGSGPGMPSLMTAAPMTVAPIPASGGCQDAINNCKSYDPSICTDPSYKQWVTQNCAMTCHMCGSGIVISMTQAPMQPMQPSSGGSGPGMPILMTAAPMTVAPMPASGGCQDAINNCKSYDPSICTDPSYKQWVTQNCAMTCHMCGSGQVISMTQAPMQPMQPSSGGCQDTINNCKDYGTSICTNADYKQWATEKCAHFCNLCGSSSGGGQVFLTAAPQGMTGSTSGCVYNSHLYQQGETWKDGCKFSCQCVDGSTGKYQCTQLCVQWNLPAQCHLNPPAPGKCCQTPACPPDYQIQYPDGYTPQ